ncbi:hypothetical protein BGW38_010525, partial [Lunasporangiospora selenospora]
IYRDLELGTIPTPEQCSYAPLSQKALACVPVLRCSRVGSTHAHFFVAVNDTLECRIKSDEGVVCGKPFKKSGSSDARLNHVISKHTTVHSAVSEFRNYQ